MTQKEFDKEIAVLLERKQKHILEGKDLDQELTDLRERFHNPSFDDMSKENSFSRTIEIREEIPQGEVKRD